MEPSTVGERAWIRGYIYYYIPLPLNVANKQASNKQATLLLSIMAIYSVPTLEALLYSLPGARAPNWEVPPKNCVLCTPNRVFFCLKQRQNLVKMDKRRKMVTKLNVRFDYPVTKSSLLLSTSTRRQKDGPRNGQKRPRLCALCVKQTENHERSGATWLETKCRGNLVHPQPPTFSGSQASKSPNETGRLQYQWSPDGAGGQCGPRMAGANSGSTMVLGGGGGVQVPRPLGRFQQVFLARFGPLMTHLGPPSIPKCLENGLLGTNNGSIMVQRCVRRKVIPNRLGCTNK